MGKSNLRLKPHQIERVGRLKVMLVEQELRQSISAETGADLFFTATDFEYRAIYAAA